MTADVFDRWLIRVTGASSRRGLVCLLGEFGLARLFGQNGAEAGRKRRQRHKPKKRRRGRKSPPAPVPPACVGNCVGKVCGDDGCGGSCGDCVGGSICEDGRCVATCCAAGTFCFEEYCTCSSSGSDFCSCPEGDDICNGAGCCLADDACVAPTDCFDSGPICACATQTCHAGNDVCRYEFAFCGSGAPGSCGCFTHASGMPLCAVMPPPDESFCPQSNECSEDQDCDSGERCANVGCCNPGVLPFVGRCVRRCPGP